MSEETVGLYHLDLVAPATMPGAPTLRLSLAVYAPAQTANGTAIVTQALAQPVVAVSHVSGPVITMTVMPQKTTMRIDLTGYPPTHFPPIGGPGPVIPPNFKAMVVMDQAFSEGKVEYSYLNPAGQWVHITAPIHKAS